MSSSRPDLRRTRALAAAFGATALLATTGVLAASTTTAAPAPAQPAPAAPAAPVAAPAKAEKKAAKADLYTGKVEVVRSDRKGDGTTITGTVFEDSNKNSSHDRGEKGLAGVVVTNGREVTKTDKRGRYTLPVYENMTVSVSQPAGFQVPVDEHNIAQFGYNHLSKGSPKLRYGGIAATGEVPSAVNFPLIKSRASAVTDQSCIMAGDLQTYSGREISYATIGALKDISDRGELGACGVLFLGDVAGDDLGLYPQMKKAMSLINGPIRLLPGNHDLDFDATDPDHSMDTFRAQMGPDYYSYNVGDTHVIALNDVRYPCDTKIDNPDGRLGSQCTNPAAPQYNGRLDDNQLKWLKADIEATSKDKLIVIASHIPFLTFADMASPVHQLDQVKDVYAMLEGRRVVHTSGHTHSIENLKAGDSYAPWKTVMGVDKLPFPHIVAGAISGDWYSGDLNEDGVPMAFQRDGGRPGVLTLDITGNEFKERFTVRGAGEGAKQMNVGLNTPTYRDWFTTLDTWRKANPNNDKGSVPPLNYNDLGDPNMVTLDELGKGSWITTNFFMGATDSKVKVSINGGKALEAQRTQAARGEDWKTGVEFSDPVSAIRQLSVGRTSQQSTSGDELAQGYRLYRGSKYGPGAARPGNNLADRMHHLWRYDLPKDLGEGVHRAEVTAIDSYGREFTQSYAFTVVKERPQMEFRTEMFPTN
ncbi:MAG: calcineurin-like phosphoesterase family protein [Dermatophilus congolensis]|nr:calcineurin-like phosphoesterase family protein [Dermatophilus congolensis]